MEHFEHIDIMQPGALVRLMFAAYAWVLDRDLWIWACAAGAATSAAGGVLCLALSRRWRLDLFTSAGWWSAAATLFAQRAPAMRWLENPTFPSLPWQVSLALFAVQWMFGVGIIAITVASLFGGTARRPEKSVDAERAGEARGARS